MFYSQFGQDKYISELFENNYEGVCIEIGVYDGINGSNTLYFENNKWECLCIEANYEAYIKCKGIRKNTLNYCVSNENSDDSIFTIYNLSGNNQSAISSLKPDDRLINSHSDLIISTIQQKVKTRTLTKILDEINFYRDIDFISIDTENTEIDVLNGIDFEYYNIKYILIENNFDEDICKNYLYNKGYIKIKRIGVDDVYIKNEYEFNSIKISRYFNIISAHYHKINKCDKFNSNVTDIVNNSLKEYIKDRSKNILSVTNDTFEDRYPCNMKKLYLNYDTIIGERCLIIDEWKTLNWNKLLFSLEKEYLFYIKPFKSNYTLGETINNDISKHIYNNNEYQLYNSNRNYYHLYKKYNIFFNLLINYNENYKLYREKYLHILNDNDNCQSYEKLKINVDIMKNIIDYEIKIKRVIDYFDHLVRNKNGINNYNDNKDLIILDDSFKINKRRIYLYISHEIDIFNKIEEINYLCMDYDFVYFNDEYKHIIYKIFKNPNIIFEKEVNLNALNTILLKEFRIEKEKLNLYEFKPTLYLCSGRLGDFLNALSVINEKYRETGSKGILYISDQNGGDNFKFGAKKAYEELYELIMKQNYIKDFKIYNNEQIDVNLNDWRNNFIDILTKDYELFYNWKNIFSIFYGIYWANTKWLNNIDYDESWSDKIVINMTTYRTASNINRIKRIVQENKNNIYFITFDNGEYEYFIERFKLDKKEVKIYLLNSLDELCIIINSCKYPYLGISSFAVIANSLHKEHSIFSCDDEFGNFTNNMVNILPHMLEFI